eukprot:evm.model.scf_1142EXC.6 EVM.evm.TU.scf_1142EXC.6   scf_1142EXC:41238-47548(-)
MGYVAQGSSAPVEELPKSRPAAQTALDLKVPKSIADTDIAWPSPDESPPFWERPARLSSQAASATGPPADIKPAEQDKKALYVVHVTAEMAPLAKVGGLGDVVTGLARACCARGHQVEVILPYYECLCEEDIEGIRHEYMFDCPKGHYWDGQWQQGSLKTDVWGGRIAGVQVFLVRPDWGACNLFRGKQIYGGSYNELEAYLYFCRSALEFLRVTGRQPHILHVHEWQASAVALLHWEKYCHNGLDIPRVVLTIHNIDNTGECTQEEFSMTGVPGEVFASVDKALDERTIGHNPERLSLLKGGIGYSNVVTTVSPTYADELLNGGAAGWLRGIFGRSDVRSKFHGVLNGIDVDSWNPETDPVLPRSFGPLAPEGKAICKEYLQKGLGLAVDPAKPLVACVTRLVPQKGIHLIRHAAFRTSELGGQFVLLGTGHADGDFRALAEGQFRGHPDVRLMLLYSEALAHLVYASADMVLVPSMFEPCGLTQMIAMRYGGVPVVRRTGGLADTVKDVDQHADDGNGFVFDGVDESSLNSALERAINKFKGGGQQWESLARRNMALDFSWDKSAASYVELYTSIAAY